MSYDEDDDIDEILGELEAELRRMNKQQRRQVRASQKSFLSWLYDAIRKIFSIVGEIISAPIKMILSVLEGLLGGFLR